MGLEHGGFCVGSSWALMAALFGPGVMNVAWMIVVAALVAIEKLLPWDGVAIGATVVFIAALGLAVALAPEKVPGLTIREAWKRRHPVHEGILGPDRVRIPGGHAKAGQVEKRRHHPRAVGLAHERAVSLEQHVAQRDRFPDIAQHEAHAHDRIAERDAAHTPNRSAAALSPTTWKIITRRLR
jgi:hypothetical protein